MEPRKKLRPAQRIRRQTTFKHLVEHGKFARGDFFYLWVCGADDASSKTKPSLGVIVSREADKRAVMRNTWKRRIREIFRAHQHDLRPDTVCLVKFRGTKRRPSFEALEKELIDLFKKAGAWA